MLLELNAVDIAEALEAKDPVIQERTRIDSNPGRMAKCLTRYDVKKNCVHIHD